MTLALILLVVLLAGGAMLYLHDRFTHGEEKAPVREPEQQCCGMHITCEKDWLRDILRSMRPDDIAGWARSLQLRQIKLPQDVRDELIMIVAEARQNRNVAVS